MDLSLMIGVLQTLGVSVTTEILTNFLKKYFSERKSDNIAEFETELESFLQINGANIKASTAIEMFAAEGLLRIENSVLYAPDKITIGANKEAVFTLGHDSVSATDRTSIETKGKSEIKGSNAEIEQKEDGSMVFKVGKDGSMKFNVAKKRKGK